MCVINDPPSQTHSPAYSNHYSRLKFVLLCEILKSMDGRTDGLTPLVKIVITAGRNCGSASWINNLDRKKLLKKLTKIEFPSNLLVGHLYF